MTEIISAISAHSVPLSYQKEVSMLPAPHDIILNNSNENKI